MTPHETSRQAGVLNVKDYLVHARLPIVLGASLLMIVSVLYAEIPLLSLVSLACVATGSLLIFSVYSFNSWTDFDEDRVNSPEFAAVGSRSKSAIFALSLSTGIATMALGLLLGLLAAITAATILTAGLLYSYPVLGALGIPRFKEIPVLKNLVAAASWAVMLTIPFSATGTTLGPVVSLLILFVFLQLLVESISRDLADRHGDAGAGFSTIPSVIGVRRTLGLLFAINTVSVAVIVASATLALYTSLILIGCAWRYCTLYLMLDERPLTFTFAKINFPTLLALVVGAILGKILV
jgi:4-hydroxybenzoate polyprenyltransferase